MAEQTVTINIGAQLTNSYQQAMSQIQKDFSGMKGISVGGSRSGSGSAMSAAEKATKDYARIQKKHNTMIERTISYLGSFLMGNKSSFNLMGIINGAMGVTETAGSGAGGAIAGAGMSAAVGALVAILAAVVALLAIMTIIKVALDGVNYAFKPIGIVLGAISKIIGATLIPLTTIVMTLLVPLIWMLMPFVRIMMLVLKPFRIFLMQELRKRKTQFEESAALGVVGGAASVGGALGALGPSLTLYMDALSGTIGRYITFMFADMAKLFTPVLAEFGKVLSFSIIDIFAFVFKIPDSEVANIKKTVGGYFDTISAEVTKQIDKMKQNATTPSAEPTVIMNAIDMLFNKIMLRQPDVATATTNLDSLFNSMTQTASSLSKLGADAYGNLIGNDDSVVNRAIQAWKGISKDAEVMLNSGDTSLRKIIAAAFQGIVNDVISSLNFIEQAKIKIQEILSAATDAVGSAIRSVVPVADAIISPGGNVITTNPADYLIATKDPSSLVGGGGTNLIFTFNVEGNIDDKTARQMTEIIKRVIATEMRSISR